MGRSDSLRECLEKGLGNVLAHLEHLVRVCGGSPSCYAQRLTSIPRYVFIRTRASPTGPIASRCYEALRRRVDKLRARLRAELVYSMRLDLLAPVSVSTCSRSSGLTLARYHLGSGNGLCLVLGGEGDVVDRGYTLPLATSRPELDIALADRRLLDSLMVGVLQASRGRGRLQKRYVRMALETLLRLYTEPVISNGEGAKHELVSLVKTLALRLPVPIPASLVPHAALIECESVDNLYELYSVLAGHVTRTVYDYLVYEETGEEQLVSRAMIVGREGRQARGFLVYYATPPMVRRLYRLAEEHQCRVKSNHIIHSAILYTLTG